MQGYLDAMQFPSPEAFLSSLGGGNRHLEAEKKKKYGLLTWVHKVTKSKMKTQHFPPSFSRKRKGKPSSLFFLSVTLGPCRSRALQTRPPGLLQEPLLPQWRHATPGVELLSPENQADSLKPMPTIKTFLAHLTEPKWRQ